MAQVRQMPNSLLQTWFDFIIYISVEKCPQCSVFTLVSAEHTRKSGMNRTSVKILRHHSGMINRMPALVKASFIYVNVPPSLDLGVQDVALDVHVGGRLEGLLREHRRVVW